MKPAELARATGKTGGAVTQWLDGTIKSLKADTAAKMETATGYNATWLVTGRGEKRSEPDGAVIPKKGDEFVTKSNVLLVGSNKRVPRLAWHEVQGFIQGMFTPTQDRFEVVSGQDIGPRCFLLENSGDAMNGPLADESFQDGALLRCDPDKPPEPKRFVIAIHPKSGEPVFRRLVKDGGVWFLKASNSSYPLVEIESLEAVIAVVVKVTIDVDL